MIRVILSSPWLPLSYWTVATIAMLCVARHESLRRGHAEHHLQRVVPVSIPTPAAIHVQLSTPPLRPSTQAEACTWGAAHFWYPQITVFDPKASSDTRSEEKVAAGTTVTSADARSFVSAPITMLSIHVDPADQTIANALAIQCRTRSAVTNAHGSMVTIHGVVTQEVVSSAGKILIMAGSRVVGSATLDPENGRFKSNGEWSVFFDDTELKIQALLLDRPGGLPGMLGHQIITEDASLQKETASREGRTIVVPRNAPFSLEVHGQLLLRDLKTSEVSN
jgi:hypothetical protein